MKILPESEAQIVSQWFQLAKEQAHFSTCERAKCGTVIVQNNKIIGKGYNSPPGNLESQRRCHNRISNPRFKSDRTCCIHAEQRAIMDALSRNPEKIDGSSLYFCRLDTKEKIQFSGQPYCTICSKMALDAGIRYFYLWHESGITEYNTEEYNTLSFAYDCE